MTDWLQCTACEEEFRVVTESNIDIKYCPFCGEDVDIFEQSEDDEWED